MTGTVPRGVSQPTLTVLVGLSKDQHLSIEWPLKLCKNASIYSVSSSVSYLRPQEVIHLQCVVADRFSCSICGGCKLKFCYFTIHLPAECIFAYLVDFAAMKTQVTKLSNPMIFEGVKQKM